MINSMKLKSLLMSLVLAIGLASVPSDAAQGPQGSGWSWTTLVATATAATVAVGLGAKFLYNYFSRENVVVPQDDGQVDQGAAYPEEVGAGLGAAAEDEGLVEEEVADQENGEDFVPEEGQEVEREDPDIELLNAASDGDIKRIACLVGQGVDVNVAVGVDVDVAVGEDGFTPLMYAAHSLSYASVELLLKHGADSTLRNGRNQTALMIACGVAGEDCTRSCSTECTDCCSDDCADSSGGCCGPLSLEQQNQQRKIIQLISDNARAKHLEPGAIGEMDAFKEALMSENVDVAEILADTGCVDKGYCYKVLVNEYERTSRCSGPAEWLPPAALKCAIALYKYFDNKDLLSEQLRLLDAVHGAGFATETPCGSVCYKRIGLEVSRAIRDSLDDALQKAEQKRDADLAKALKEYTAQLPVSSPKASASGGSMTSSSTASLASTVSASVQGPAALPPVAAAASLAVTTLQNWPRR